MQIVLGKEVLFKDRPMLVVRMIENSRALFEREDGTCYILQESYAELKDSVGNIEFIELSRTEHPCSDKKSQVKGLSEQIWRPQLVKA